MDYKVMYALLLGEIDKALTLMESGKNFEARQVLMGGLEACEDQYIDSVEKAPITGEILSRLLGYCQKQGDDRAAQALTTQFGYLLREE